EGRGGPALPRRSAYLRLFAQVPPSASLDVPSGQVVCDHTAPWMFAPLSEAPVRFAFVKSTRSRSALFNVAFARSARWRSAPLRSESRSAAPVRSMPSRNARFRLEL